MVRLINLLQPLFNDMRINLRRRNIRMTQHQLHRPQIRAAFQQNLLVSSMHIRKHFRIAFHA